MTLQISAALENPFSAPERTTSPQPGCQFVPQCDVVVVTENSIWTIRPTINEKSASREVGGTYLRVPKNDPARPPAPSYEDRLEDHVIHGYERLVWTTEDLYPGELRLNIKPTVKVPGGIGIMTGVILSVEAGV